MDIPQYYACARAHLVVGVVRNELQGVDARLVEQRDVQVGPEVADALVVAGQHAAGRVARRHGFHKPPKIGQRHRALQNKVAAHGRGRGVAHQHRVLLKRSLKVLRSKGCVRRRTLWNTAGR
jgi:hypothetical protein